MVGLELSGVTARYDADPTPRLVDVDLRLARGEVGAVLGANGAGKSTLVRIASGQLALERGRATILGDEVSALDPRERARRVAVVPQRSDVAFGFTVREVVAMGRAPHLGRLMRAGPADAEAVEEALARCSLLDLASRPVQALSGGEQKRVHIARALAQHAPVMLLDEAAAHLDIRHVSELYGILRAEVSRRDLACLFTTHDLAAASAHADWVLLLREGRVVAHGPPEEVLRAEPLEATFGVPVEVGRHPDGRRYFLVS
ncbi:MAG: ABC transporter ATP-binding protein [Polyangiaceae bacterium]